MHGPSLRGHANRGAEVELLHILNDPTSLLQLLVDLLAGFGFRCHAFFLLTVYGAIAHALSPVVDRSL